MIRCCAIAIFAALWLSGCVHYRVWRTSTLQGSNPSTARMHLTQSRETIVGELETSFAQRGFPVVNKIEVNPWVVYYFFKGKRDNVTSVYGEEGYVTSQSNNVGSWFVARLASYGDTTDVLMFGKPTFNGVEVCSDADSLLAEIRYWCTDTKLQDGVPEADFMTGREEREVLRGVQVALQDAR